MVEFMSALADQAAAAEVAAVVAPALCAATAGYLRRPNLPEKVSCPRSECGLEPSEPSLRSCWGNWPNFAPPLNAFGAIDCAFATGRKSTAAMR